MNRLCSLGLIPCASVHAARVPAVYLTWVNSMFL